MKLSDIPMPIPKILLWGKPATGKTPFVMSYGEGMQMIDTDRGLLSSIKLQDKFTAQRHAVDVITCYEDDPNKAQAFAKFKQTVMDVYNQCVKKTYPYKVLAVDSFTTIADYALRSIQGNSSSFGKAVTQQQWGLAINEIDNCFMWLKAMPIPVVVIFHAREGVDHSDHVTEEISIYGKNLPAKIISYFDEVLKMKMNIFGGKPEPVIMTMPEAYTTIRSRGSLKSGQKATEISFKDLLTQLGWKEGGAPK